MLLIISNATIPDDDEVTHVGTENWTGDLYGALIATKGAIIGSSNIRKCQILHCQVLIGMLAFHNPINQVCHAIHSP